MNKRILMVSTAAIALAVSCGVVSAQEGKGGGAPAASSGGASAGGAVSPGGASGAASSKGDVAAPNSAASERGSAGADNAATGSKSGATAQDTAKGGAQQAQDNKAGTSPSKSQAASDDAKTDNKSGNKSANDTNARDNKNSTADKSNANEGKTTGNAATSATAAPPAEKRSQISTAFKQEKIAETTNVNFNISVGTRVPASVHFYPVPERIVSIYPEWRGYDVIFVHGRYIIVRPETHDIVYIIEG